MTELIRVYYIDKDGEYTGKFKDCMPLNAEHLHEIGSGTTVPPNKKIEKVIEEVIEECKEEVDEIIKEAIEKENTISIEELVEIVKPEKEESKQFFRKSSKSKRG